MILKDLSFDDPRENLLYDDVLLSLAEEGQGKEVLRFWESPKLFIVLGRTGKEQEDIHLNRACNDGIMVLRRSSGGGTVVQGKGCLNYSLILSKENYPEIGLIRQSYRYILEKVTSALASLGVEAGFKPTSDLASGPEERKFSGNAQRRGKKFILHHGTLLYDFDLELITKYLKIPNDIPEYRQGRTHADFVMNLKVSPEEIKQALKKAFPVSEKGTDIDPKEADCLKEFLNSRDITVKNGHRQKA